MYVILTSKPGQFRTEAVAGIVPLEAYDYLFGSTPKARFVIAELREAVKVRVIDEGEPPVVNLVPAKFLPRYATLEAARAELQHLAAFGSLRAALRPVPA
ncbi:ferredoxin [Siccirubricoccus phaeus]|uniref:ferredoxin n=1 Tax=Siccirubricoccus phaeus TaxID=2595053 RepID=UPI0011F32C7F|nr:ferredoxin [Siccirubricoccus phaeus]